MRQSANQIKNNSYTHRRTNTAAFVFFAICAIKQVLVHEENKVQFFNFSEKSTVSLQNQLHMPFLSVGT